LHLFGNSRIIAPNGEIACQAPYVSPGAKSESFLLVSRLDARKELEDARTSFGNLLEDRRPELYSTLAKSSSRT